MLSCKTNKIMLRVVCGVLICGLLLSGAGIPSYAVTNPSDSALAPPLATKPPCEIVQKSDGSYDVVTDNSVTESWDRETARSVKAGETLGKTFRNRWAFVDVSYLIGQMLILTQEHNLQNPKDILIPLLKKHIQNRDGMTEIRLEGFDIDSIEEVRGGRTITGFSLLVMRNGSPAYRLVYNLQGGDTAIQMRDGKSVYVKVENTVSLPLVIEMPQVIKDISDALAKKSINNKGILTVEGVAGSGKTYVGSLIKRHGVGGFASNEIAVIDTDDYLPKMIGNGFDRMLVDESGTPFIPIGRPMTDYCQFSKFERDLASLSQKHRLVVVVGLFTPLFFQKLHLPNPDIRVLLKNTEEANRMRVIRRDGYIDKYIESIERAEDLQKALKTPFDVVVTNGSIRLLDGRLITHQPSIFSFVLSKIYGKVVNEFAWEVTPDTAFETLSNEIENRAKSVLNSKVDLSSRKISDVEAVIAGTFSAIRHLFSKGEQSVIVTVRTCEKGFEVVIDVKGEQILPAKEAFAGQSLLKPLGSHIPEIVITTSHDWYGRTFYKRWENDWIVTKGGRYAFAIPTSVPEQHGLGWRAKESDGDTRPADSSARSENLSSDSVSPPPASHLVSDEHQEDVVTRSAFTPESERIHTTNLQDTLTYIQTQPQTQSLIVALGTSWIKGYEKGRYLQYDALNPLIGSLRTYCESKGIPFIVDTDDKLLAQINAERAKDGRSGAKVVVLAGKDTVASNEFTTLRNDQKNAFVVGVDNQELTTDSYIRLMEMLTLALKLSAGLEISLNNDHMTITRDNERHLYIFLPHAEPMDYEKLKVIYEVQKFA